MDQAGERDHRGRGRWEALNVRDNGLPDFLIILQEWFNALYRSSGLIVHPEKGRDVNTGNMPEVLEQAFPVFVAGSPGLTDRPANGEGGLFAVAYDERVEKVGNRFRIKACRSPCNDQGIAPFSLAGPDDRMASSRSLQGANTLSAASHGLLLRME